MSNVGLGICISWLIFLDHSDWLTLHKSPHVSMWQHGCFTNTMFIHCTAHTQKRRSSIQFLMLFSLSHKLFFLHAGAKWLVGALTLLSMAPMMLGPWHCSRLSWLTGWLRIRFFTISRKAAMLFLSSLPSEKKKKKNSFSTTNNHFLCYPQSQLYITKHFKDITISQDDTGFCVISVWLFILSVSLCLCWILCRLWTTPLNCHLCKQILLTFNIIALISQSLFVCFSI